MGIYLGPSQRYARYISLILNLDTVMVSMKIYVYHDNFFGMVKFTDSNPPTLYHWQQLYVFKRDMSHHIQPQGGRSGMENISSKYREVIPPKPLIEIRIQRPQVKMKIQVEDDDKIQHGS